jgi:hypothetical protein
MLGVEYSTGQGRERAGEEAAGAFDADGREVHAAGHCPARATATLSSALRGVMKRGPSFPFVWASDSVRREPPIGRWASEYVGVASSLLL